MMQEDPPKPTRSCVYKNFPTDSERWDAYEPRGDDVIISTPAKNGTTWMQAICALLIHRTPELDFNPAERSRWFDEVSDPIEDVVAALDAETERRVIKTHTPLDGIPYIESSTYITVYRDPRDAFFSLRNHIDNWKKSEIEISTDPDVEFRSFVDATYTPGASTPSLDWPVRHFDSFWRFRQLPNIHLFHYSDLKRDLIAEMRRVAQALEIEIDPTLLARLADSASFDNMKSKADLFVPGASKDGWKSTSRFLHKGTSGQWKGTLSDAALEAFEEKLAKLLPLEPARWLKEGRRGEGDLNSST